MTDLEQELVRQIHELGKEVKELRERVVRLEIRTVQPITFPTPQPPWVVTCGGAS